MIKFSIPIIFIVSLISVALPTQAAELRVAPELQTVAVSEVFSVDIEWVAGTGWIGGSFAVRYDESLLQFVDYTYGDLGDPQFNGTPVLSDGLIDRLGFGTFKGLGEGVALTLEFVLRKPGQALIDVTAYGDWSNGVDFLLRQPDATDGAVGSDGVSRGDYPDTLYMEDVPLGETVEFQVELTSIGTAPLRVFDVVVPADQDVFSVVADNCSSLILQLEESCFVTVSAVAFEFGSHANHITNIDFVTSDVIDQGANTRLILSNRRPELHLPRVEFYDGRLSAPFVRKTVPVTNIGQWPADMSSVRMDGNQRANFIVLENRCKGVLLPVGEFCEILMEFRPTTAREYNASYVFRYGNEALFQRANIVGYTPTGLPWVDGREVTDWVQVSGDDQTRTITINNKGSVPLSFTNSSIQSTNGFSVIDSCTGSTLPSGGACTITLESSHLAAGDYQWNGWIHTDSLRSPRVTLAANLTVTAQ